MYIETGYGSGSTALPTNVGQIAATKTPYENQYVTSGWEKLTGADKAVLRQGARDAILREEAEKNRQFQERLSSSAYQRAMQDMKKAGLNPALLYGGAKPASTASGAIAGTAGAGASASPVGVISSVLALAGAIATKGMSLAAKGSVATSALAAKKIAPEPKWLNDFLNKLPD